MRDRSGSWALRYGLALAAVAAATILRLALDPLVGMRFPFATLFFAVLVSAWVGGFGPALLATVSGAVAASWFLLAPRFRLLPSDPEDWGGLVLYLAVSLGIAAIGRAMQRARTEAEAEAGDAAARREELRVTLQSIGDGVITTDTRGRVTSMNAIASQLTGWTVADALGQPLEVVFHIIVEATRQPTPSPVVTALAEGRVVGLANHTLLVARDGSERPIDDSAAPIRDEDGQVTGVVLVFRDGSERRATERAQGLLANVVELSDDAIVTKRLDGVVTSWNAGAARIFGYSRDEMVGQPITRIIPPDRANEVGRILGAIGRGERVEPFESERICKDGRRINVSLSVSPIRDAEGTVIGASKIARDVTARKRAEIERQSMLRELTTLYTVGQAVSAELDRERVLQIITDAATDLSGATVGAFVYGAPAAPGDPRPVYTLSGAAGDGGEPLGAARLPLPFAPTFDGDRVVRIADVRTDPRHGRYVADDELPPGHLPVASYLAVPVTSRTGEVFGALLLGHPEPGVFTTNSERVVVALAAQAAIRLENSQLYEAEQQARSAAEHASREKDHFLAMLGHELRNPLAAVRNALNASLLDPARRDRALAIAAHAAGQLNRLVDDLLDVTRVTQGRLTLRTEALDLGEVVQRAVEAMRPLFDERRVALSVALPHGECLVEGDATRLEQVAGNLLANAAKYTEPGGRVAVVVDRLDDAAVVRVTDTGIGIAPELLPRIFELFVQAGQALDRSRGGLGIGLTLVKELVELHGGSVQASSAGVGQGAEFVVRLPLGTRRPDASPAVRLPQVVPTATRVLIVEDNENAAESLTILLQIFGFDVKAVGDGAAALAALAERRPDVMLIDIGLPGMSGYELAERVREGGARDIVLVAMTGYGQDEDRRQAFAAGFDHHLVKPVEVDRLRQLMTNVTRPTTDAADSGDDRRP